MSFEEEFDKIIRQKSEEMEYPFEAKHWEQASTLIDADRKATRLVTFKKRLKPALTFVALASAVTMAFLLLKNESTPTQVAVSNEKSQSRLSENLEQASKNSLNNPQSDPSNSSITSVEAASQAYTNNQSIKKDLASKETLSQSPSPSPSQKKQPESAQHSTTQAEDEQTIDPTVSQSSAPVEASHNSASNEPSVPAIGAGIIPPVNASSAQTQQTNETNVSETELAAQTEIKNESATLNDQTTVDQLSAFNLSLPYAFQERSLQTENMLSMIKYDDAYFKQKSKTHYLNIEAGIAYMLGWNTNAGTDGKGLDYFGGINYGFYLNNKFSIGIGAQVYNFANMDEPYYTSSHKEYDFGSISVYTVVTCNQLYYAAIPIKVNYAINSSNIIGLGFNAAYAFSANTHSESYYYQDNAKIILNSSTEKGIYEGINQYNYMLTANYALKFSKRIGINAEAVYGLSDLFNNTSETNSTEQTIGLRLGLTYTIFDK